MTVFEAKEKAMAQTATTSRLIKESEYDPNNSLAKKSGWPKQTFHISHLREEDFTNEGFRAYTLVRDLGFAKATGGMVQAHVNRRARPFNAAEVSKPHFHDTLFQMVYILKGWVRSEFEGHGIIEMREGSSWIQPPGIKHCVRDYSDDLELLEIILPAEYDTVNIAGPVTEKS
jgi:quercetin dioxygenase-like cupin family protein